MSRNVLKLESLIVVSHFKSQIYISHFLQFSVIFFLLCFCFSAAFGLLTQSILVFFRAKIQIEYNFLQGETPYSIDQNSQKPIIGQIFGTRRLNANEDGAVMLGYDLYSSALANILTEPQIAMPITGTVFFLKYI